MTVTVQGENIGGKIRVPESKSHAHRLLICAALSGKKTEILCKNSSSDIDATCRCLKGLGVISERTENGFILNGGGEREKILPCGESGSTYRFILPIACALGHECGFFLEGKLPVRPMEPLMENLEAHGIKIAGKGEETVHISGKLTGGKFKIPGDVSSQFISGLIFALPILNEDSEIEITGTLQSESYVKMTLDAVRQFGIEVTKNENGFFIKGGQKYTSPEKVTVEGDWSNAAFWLCAGAIGENPVTCSNLNVNSTQGDKKVLEILSSFGADVREQDGDITVSKGELKGIVIDAMDIPDLVPILSVVASVAKGETRVINAQRLRLKESDRIFTVCETIRNLGGNIEETKDGLIIQGGKLKGGAISSFNDHRIAMSGAIASIVTEGAVKIEGSQAVNKSYPEFWNDFMKLGGNITKEESEK